MKNQQHQLNAAVVVVMAVMALANPAPAANSTWSGASGTGLLWSTAGNWSPSGSPGVNDTAQFFDNGATNAVGSAAIDNEVSANKTIQYLWLSQTNGIHNMQIDSGVTLTVAGTNYNGYGPIGSDPNNLAPTNGIDTMFVGTRNPATATTGVTNTISGGGTLVLNNTNNELNVRQVFAGSGNVLHQGVLNMSGLNTFTAKLGRIRVGDGENAPLSRAQGQLFLAITNNITLTGTNSADNAQLVVGNNDVNNNGNSSVSFMYLGQVNTLYLDMMLISGQKQQGQLLLNTNFASPTILMRGHDGVSRVSAIRIGDESDAGATSGPSTGTVNFLAGTSDILADTIILGKGQNGNNNNTTVAIGTLVVGSGKLDVNNLLLAEQFVSNQGGVMTGTATFSNTTVVVNKLLELGHSAGAAPARIANLNITGGSFTLASNLVTQGTATINVTNSVLALLAHPSVLASVINLDGGVISNAATLKVTNTLTIVNNGQIIGGNPVFDLGNSGTAVWTVSGTPTGGLVVSNVLQGSGSINGNLTQAAGATLNPGGSGAAGTLTVGGNMTLSAGTLKFDLSNSGSGVNDQINASGTVTLSGTNAVNLSALNGAFDTVNPYTLITSGGLAGGDQTYFTPAGGLGQSRYTFTFTTDASTVKLSVSGVGPANLTWVGDGSANNWDLKTTPNWNNGTPNQQFYSLDAVTFDDSGSASPAVNLVGTLNPGSITVSNTVKNYTFSGTGGLTGAGLAKSGTGSLTLNNTGDNTFAGLVAITNGVLTLNNTGLNTFVNGLTTVGGGVSLTGANTNVFNSAGSVAIGVGTSLTIANANANTFNAVPIQLDGSLTVTQAVDSVMDSAINGAGALTKAGAGALTLSGVNSGLSSVVQINTGTIKAGTTTALGSSGVIVTNSATLDLNGKSLSALPAVTVSGPGVGGKGAIVSTAGILITGSSGNGLASVTLAGDTTFGGSGPWNTDPIKNVGCWGITTSLSTGGAGYNVTKVGTNQVSLTGATVDTALGNIDVQQGLFDLAGGTTSLGNPASNLTVRAGAQLSLNNTSTPWDKKFILFGDGVTPNLLDYNGANAVIGTVTLNGSCVIGGVDPSRGAPISITLSSPVGGAGSLTKSGVDALILAATNAYSGTTTVAGGRLLVEGVSGTNGVTVSGGVLGGIGIIRGAVTISSGGTLAPGDAASPFGILILSNSLSLGGTCSNNLDKTSGIFSSSQVTNLTTLTIGGALQLNLTGETLVNGDSFKLFSFASASGAFTSITPVTPADGLQWDTSHLTTDGTLRVISVNTTPAPITAGVSGNQLTLSWPMDHIGWKLQAQTNALNLGLGTNWVDVPGSTLVNTNIVTMDPANGSVFYRMIYPP
jgi:autotransporter-associated beta strand protein